MNEVTRNMNQKKEQEFRDKEGGQRTFMDKEDEERDKKNLNSIGVRDSTTLLPALPTELNSWFRG